MSNNDKQFDLVVVGAGVGGMSAAIAAARTKADVLLIEVARSVGGTGVHSPVTLINTFFDRSGRVINGGVHREFFPHIYTSDCWQIQTYDERELARNYERAIMNEPTLTVWCDTRVTEVDVDVLEANAHGSDRCIRRVRTEGAHAGWVVARNFVDSTANGNLSALAGAEYALGRDRDKKMQPATLTFKVTDIDFSKFTFPLPKGTVTTWDELNGVREELTVIYKQAKERCGLKLPREDVLCFPYPEDQKSLLFNQTRILGVDPTDAASVERGMVEGRGQIDDFMQVIQEHPAFRQARIESISKVLGIREGRRIIGDYILTGEDCLGEARFEDMVAAGGYHLDIHSPDGEGTSLTPIPGSGYYHIPYRSIRAKTFTNLVMGSRCISGTHEAHSSYRVMPPVSSIGQAAGTAAALAALMDKGDVRDIPTAQIRYILDQNDQFTEGDLEPVSLGSRAWDPASR